MTTTIESMKPTLLALGAEERLELADFLYDSVPEDNEFDEEYMKEVNRRSDELDAGLVTGRTVDEALAEYRERFG